MKKQVLIFLTVFTILSTLAEEPTITNNPSVINLEQEKQIWKQTQHQSYLTHLAQRETFLQIENLLKSAVKNQQFSENTQELTKNLMMKKIYLWQTMNSTNLSLKIPYL